MRCFQISCIGRRHVNRSYIKDLPDEFYLAKEKMATFVQNQIVYFVRNQ